MADDIRTDLLTHEQWIQRCAFRSEEQSPAPMTVIDIDQWEPCSPSYLSRGGNCGKAPRVWDQHQCNHWHPKLQLPREPVAFAWRQKGTNDTWKVCFDVSQAPDPADLPQTEIRMMSWHSDTLG